MSLKRQCADDVADAALPFSFGPASATPDPNDEDEAYQMDNGDVPADALPFSLPAPPLATAA